MATNSIRRKQRALAVNRLTEAAKAAAETFGIEEVEIPTFDKDAEYLVTLQIDAAASVLEAAVKALSEPRRAAKKPAAKDA